MGGHWAFRGAGSGPRAVSPPGSSQVENIQPFSAKDLSIRSLGDRIRDLGQLRNLYPNTPKDQAFGSHYNSELGGAEGAARGAEGFGSRVLLPRLVQHRPMRGGGSRLLLLSLQKSRRARTAAATSPPPSR